MRIGIVSDTHGSVPMSLADRLSDCNAVIHAGDIGRQKVLDDIRSLVPNTPVYPVLGNCDVVEQVPFDGDVPLSNVLLFDDVAFVVAHEPESTAFSLSEFLSSPVYSILGDVVAVHGHTHTPDINASRIDDGIVWLCPGALSNPRDDWQRTIAKVDVEGKRVLGISIETMSGNVAWDWRP